MNGCAPRLALRKRLKVIRKYWPILLTVCHTFHIFYLSSLGRFPALSWTSSPFSPEKGHSNISGLFRFSRTMRTLLLAHKYFTVVIAFTFYVLLLHKFKQTAKLPLINKSKKASLYS